MMAHELERRPVTMNVQYERIARVQQGMREQGLIAIVVLNHDDYRYLFGEDRWQPRALIPFQGPPELIAFTGEEPELRAALADGRVRVFGSVGGQINDIVGRLRELVAEGAEAGIAPGASGRPRVGIQMWFHTPGVPGGPLPPGQPRGRGRLLGSGHGPAPDGQGCRGDQPPDRGAADRRHRDGPRP